MASTPILPEYDELEDELRALDAVNATEAHGVIAGVASSMSAPANAGIHIVLGDVDADSAVVARRLLEAVGGYTEALLAARESEFELLLPDEAQPLDTRASALADFCRGYVMGLVAGGVHEFAALPGDAREVVEDFMKIAEAQAGNAAEAEEQALAELAEYVRTRGTGRLRRITSGELTRYRCQSPIAACVKANDGIGRAPPIAKKTLKSTMMKITMTVVVLVAGIGVGTAAYADAGTRDPGVNARQHRQHDRIHQGVRSGELTKEEAKGLAKEQRAIRKEERAYKSDGKLTKEERKDLHRDLNQASRDVYREKHDAEKR